VLLLRWLVPRRLVLPWFVLAGQQPDRRGPGARAGDRVGDALGVPAVLVPVGRVDLVVEAVVGVGEGHLPVHAPGLDAAFVADLGAAEPGRGRPVDGPDIQAAAV